MGLLEKLRGELVDIVEWMDHTRDTLVWRFPRYHNQIKNGAQLIVNDYWRIAIDEGCDFVHLGQEDLLDADIAALAATMRRKQANAPA